jgi:calcineurin-like phosphoesterase family protein
MILNLVETDDRKIYVGTDFHLGHQQKFVYEARGFGCVRDHDEAIIASVNARVRPNDILIFLGDWCLNTKMEQFDAYLDAVKCQNIYALWGNHNNPHEKAVYYNGIGRKFVEGILVETYPFRYKNMLYLPSYVEAILNGQYCILQHYPIMVWNHMKNGAWMLCGHSHGAYEPTSANYPEGKILDCNWDDFGKPLSLPEIRAIMDKKKIVGAGHHQPDEPVEPKKE